jgi:hypothetical protein
VHPFEHCHHCFEGFLIGSDTLYSGSLRSQKSGGKIIVCHVRDPLYEGSEKLRASGEVRNFCCG